jgi:hypothetical protein
MNQVLSIIGIPVFLCMGFLMLYAFVHCAETKADSLICLSAAVIFSVTALGLPCFYSAVKYSLVPEEDIWLHRDALHVHTEGYSKVITDPVIVQAYRQGTRLAVGKQEIRSLIGIRRDSKYTVVLIWSLPKGVQETMVQEGKEVK